MIRNLLSIVRRFSTCKIYLTKGKGECKIALIKKKAAMLLTHLTSKTKNEDKVF